MRDPLVLVPGLEFFEKVVALQAKHAKPGQRIENDLQTNGTLLDDDWARFLKARNFLVGLSIDGPREIHDHCRITKHAEPTFDQVFAAAKMLQKHGVRFNTLTCVHRYNASRPFDVYRFLRREIGSTYIQFIPIVERVSGAADPEAPGPGFSGSPGECPFFLLYRWLFTERGVEPRHLERGLDLALVGAGWTPRQLRQVDALRLCRVAALAERDLMLEALVPVVQGRVPLLVHVERGSDILTLLALKREVPSLRLVLVGATEGWTVARDIAAAGVPVIASAIADLPESFEQLAATQSNIGRMKAAGVLVGIGTINQDEARQARWEKQYAGNLVALGKIPGASGLSWGEAFATITSRPAEALGMGGEFGSLKPGRRGDVVIWDGDPLEIGTSAVNVFIDGVEMVGSAVPVSPLGWQVVVVRPQAEAYRPSQTAELFANVLGHAGVIESLPELCYTRPAAEPPMGTGAFDPAAQSATPEESVSVPALLNAKLVTDPVSVAPPIRVHAPPLVTSTADTTETCTGRSIPPPSQMPPRWSNSMWTLARASSWSLGSPAS